MSGSQTLGLTDEHHDWATQFLGIDTRADTGPITDGLAGPDQAAAPANAADQGAEPSMKDSGQPEEVGAGAADLNAGPPPADVNAMAVATPPGSAMFAGGRNVFRSTHAASVINSTGRDITYQVDVMLSDSAGHRATDSYNGQVAPGSGSQSSSCGPFNLELPASNYTAGDRVTFTSSTRVSGGVSASAQNSNTLTIGAMDTAEPLTDAAAAQGVAADAMGSAATTAETTSAGPPGQDEGGGQSSPPGSGTDAAEPTDASASEPRRIGVTIVTHYDQQVRYWIQDLAIDYNNEALLGSGTTLVNGDAYGAGESISLTCIETANGAAVGYRRESYPYPPGGGETPWTHVLISEGDTATMIL